MRNPCLHLFPAIALSVAVASLPRPALAQEVESPPALSKATARALLSQAMEVSETTIAIAYILEGEKALKGGFTSKASAATIYLVTELENGHRRRRCREQIFLFTPEFGWFLEQVVQESGRDYLRIWSERRGYVEFE